MLVDVENFMLNLYRISYLIGMYLPLYPMTDSLLKKPEIIVINENLSRCNEHLKNLLSVLGFKKSKDGKLVHHSLDYCVGINEEQYKEYDKQGIRVSLETTSQEPYKRYYWNNIQVDEQKHSYIF